MTKFFAAFFVAVFAGCVIQSSAQEKQALRLVQTIPLPGVTGRLDHMGVDLEKNRLFVAAVSNNTLEVIDAHVEDVKALSSQCSHSFKTSNTSGRREHPSILESPGQSSF
jgi:hypothetical protein